jgi:hypothetical protein
VTRRAIIVNVIAYQCAWFTCVLSAAAGRPMVGVLVVAAALLWHLRQASMPLRELQLIAIVTAIGAVFESALVASGLVRMPAEQLLGGVTPLWMVALWAAFASTLNVSLRSLRTRTTLCTVLAGLGAPLAYLAGVRLGALQWAHTLPALLVIGAAWALVTPLLLRSAQRFDGYAAT